MRTRVKFAPPHRQQLQPRSITDDEYERQKAIFLVQRHDRITKLQAEQAAAAAAAAARK